MNLKGWYKTMKKEEFVKLGIDEETAKKLEEASQEELKGYIPKARFDEVNNEKKKLELDVRDRDGQLETLKNSTGDVDAMKKQIEDLQKANKDAADKHAAEIEQLKIETAVDVALDKAKAKNKVAVKALLKDMDKAELDADGTIKGLAEQIKALQKSDSYLFDTKDSKNKFKGAEPGESGNEDGDKGMNIEQFRKMSPAERYQYSINNPEEYKNLYERGN